MPPPEPPADAVVEETADRRRGDREDPATAPGDPTVGAGIADTGGSSPATRRSSPPSSSARPCSCMCGPGSAILAADAIGILGVALAFGFALLVLAYVIGPISGCHINPAITLGMLLAKKITPRTPSTPGSPRSLGGIFGAVVDLRHRQRPRRLGAGDLRLQRLGPRRLQRARRGDHRRDRVHRAVRVRRADDDRPPLRPRLRRARRRHHARR